jgi:hypothetical protein
LFAYSQKTSANDSSIISLLQAAIGSFSSAFPDYQERIARHEAAHFLSMYLCFSCNKSEITISVARILLTVRSLCELVSYLTGLPILGYSLDIGKEHVNLVDKQLEKLIYSGKLDQKELDRYSLCFSLSKYVHNFCTPLFILHSVRLLHQTVDCNLTCN